MSYSAEILTYIRNLFGWGVDTSSKRDRADDGLLDDDVVPACKRHKLNKTNFPGAQNSRDVQERQELRLRPYVRNVPISVEPRLPTTSTPLETGSKLSRVHAIPINFQIIKENGSSTPGREPRKPRMHTPIHTHSHMIDEDDEPEINVQQKRGSKKLPKLYIELDDDDDDYEETHQNENDDDVQFVKKISAPQPLNPYRYFDSDTSESLYSKMSRKLNDRTSTMSPKSFSKFVAPAGITKPYRKAPPIVSKWLQGPGATKPSNLPRNRFYGQNGNTRATMSEVFNLDEKNNYQELIRKARSMKPATYGRSSDFINLTDEAESFRNTMRLQRKALNEIRFAERGVVTEKKNDLKKEYGPLVIASLNSSDSEVEVVPSETSTSSSSRIEPINTLRDSYRDVAVTSTDWLTRLDSKYKKKRQLTREKLVDAKRESDIISKVNSEQKIAQLEHKLKYELSIPESLYEEPQPTVELPALTPEQEKLVSRALGPGPPGSLIIEKFGLRIHKRDLQTLSGLNWLNDEVINFYMNLLMQRNESRKDLPRVYAANTFFYPKLMQGGQAGLRRWTRKVDIFAHDLMVLPVHLGVHWCVSIVDFRAKKISYLDSMGGPNRACLEALLSYLRDEHQDKKGQPFNDKGWKTETLKDIPQQMNGSDCGMFACTFAEFSARDAPYSFTQAHMPYLRRKMALEIITGQLLL